MVEGVLQNLLRRREVIALAVLLVLFCLHTDWNLSRRNGGIDLRNRVVGARLLLEGRDPYFFRWSGKEKEELIDPWVGPRQLANRCTVTPPMLALYAPFSSLRYRTQQKIWFFIETGLAFVLLGLIVHQTPPARRATVLFVFLLVFVFSECWRMHIERGQIYVLYAGLAAFSAWLALRYQQHFLAGMVLGLLTVLRPVFIFTCLPFFLDRRWRVLAGGCVGILLALTMSVASLGARNWGTYFRAMDAHARTHLQMKERADTLRRLERLYSPELRRIKGVVTTDTDFEDLIVYIDEDAEADEIQTQAEEVLAFGLKVAEAGLVVRRAYPPKIEGSRRIYNHVYFPTGSSGFMRVFRELDLDDPLQAMKLLFLVVAVLYTGALWRFQSGSGSMLINFVTATALVVMVEFFLPAPRYVYMNIGWAVPLLLLIGHFGMARTFSGVPGVILAFGLVMSFGLLTPSWDDEAWGDWAMLAYWAWTLPQLGSWNEAVQDEAVSGQDG